MWGVFFLGGGSKKRITSLEIFFKLKNGILIFFCKKKIFRQLCRSYDKLSLFPVLSLLFRLFGSSASAHFVHFLGDPVELIPSALCQLQLGIQIGTKRSACAALRRALAERSCHS